MEMLVHDQIFHREMCSMICHYPCDIGRPDWLEYCEVTTLCDFFYGENCQDHFQ